MASSRMGADSEGRSALRAPLRRLVDEIMPETKDRECPEVDAELQARAKGEVRPPAGLPGRTT